MNTESIYEDHFCLYLLYNLLDFNVNQKQVSLEE